MKLLKVATEFDHIWFYIVQCTANQRPKMIEFFKLLSKTADGYLLVVLFGYLYIVGSYGLLTNLLWAIVIERVVYFIVKNKAKRNRPPDILPSFNSIIKAADKFSFPSGHTSGAFFTAMVFATVAPTYAVLAYIWAGLIGLSRVVLGVHFPTDTVAGATLGTLIAFCAIYL